MASPIIQIIPQIIQRASGGTCLMCCQPALVALRASVAKHQQEALKNKIPFQVAQKDVVIFGACFKHQSFLVQLRANLLIKDYYFNMPK